MISLFCLLRRIKNAELLTAEILLFINTQKLKISSRLSPKIWFELSTFNHIQPPLSSYQVYTTEIAGEFLYSVCFTIVFTGFSGCREYARLQFSNIENLVDCSTYEAWSSLHLSITDALSSLRHYHATETLRFNMLALWHGLLIVY